MAMDRPDQPFELNSWLDALYATHRAHQAWKTEDIASLEDWQTRVRHHLRELLGLNGRPEPAVAEVEVLGRYDYEGYTEEKQAVTTEEGVVIPLYFLIPHREGPHRAIVVFHGHSPSVQYTLGHYPDSASAADYLARDGNYAQGLAQAGFLVCAVEQRGFGERLSQLDVGRMHANSCRHLAFFYQMMGRTLVGERCRDGMVALDVVAQRNDVRRHALGITGNSGGGTTTLWLGALDPRPRAVVTGSYFCTFRGSIMNLRHCECNYVPGVAAHYEMGDIAALIAPRPHRIVQGEFDPIFPIEETRREFRRVQRVYQSDGLQDRLDLKVFPTGHAYNTSAAVDWFRQWL